MGDTKRHHNTGVCGREHLFFSDLKVQRVDILFCISHNSDKCRNLFCSMFLWICEYFNDQAVYNPIVGSMLFPDH